MDEGIIMKAINQVITDKYAIYEGDSCELMKAMPDNSIGFGVHSPPFEGLYRFSNSDRDVSNNSGEDFWKHYKFIISELLRTTKPGRACSVHVMQLPTSKSRHGFIGLRDFRGEVIRAYQDCGWQFVSEVCIWKDPVVAQQRTKSIRLLHKQVVKDSIVSGQGLADYVVTFKKPGENEEPISGGFDMWIGEGDGPDPAKWTTRGDSRNWFSIECWQKYASPVWTDIDQNRTLQYRNARDAKDEVHISPLQLDVIERCIALWSNEGDTVFTPFMGIGSEVYAAIEMGRLGVGIELKASYFKQACKNISEAARRTNDLFSNAGD
jgi:hypothetical protein